MDASNIASIIVAVIAMGSAYASQRSAAKASVLNTTTTSRVDMEKDAYLRAQAFDTATINRLEKQNIEYQARIVALETNDKERLKTIDDLQKEVYRLKRTITNLAESRSKGVDNERNDTSADGDPADTGSPA